MKTICKNGLIHNVKTQGLAYLRFRDPWYGLRLVPAENSGLEKGWS